MLNEYCAWLERGARWSARGAPARRKVIPAMRTDHVRRGLRPASTMYQRHRRPRFVAEPGVAPSHHRDQNRIELESFPGQPILDASAVAFATCAIEDSVAHQVAQSRAQDVTRDAGALLKLIKPVPPHKRLAQYQHRPALADHRQRSRNRAIRVLDRIPSHGRLTLPPPEFFGSRDVPQRHRRNSSLHFET